MTQTTRPPFRADHVGSLLRPEKLKEARETLLGPQTADAHLGPHDNEMLTRIEDDCIRDVVTMQEKAGLRAVTDGEFRRRSWWLELILTWSGVSANRQDASSPFGWKNEQGKQQNFSHLQITGPIKWKPSAVVKAFEFLRDNTNLVPKVTIPSPPVVHAFSGGDPMILDRHYDDMDEFWADLIAAYRQELAALVAAGARYIQMDDVTLPFICDSDYADVFRSWGSSPEEVLADYAKRMNAILEDLPDDVTITMHQCRGNREGLWSAEGGYDPVADVLFNQINVHGYFLEYDTPRAGTFEPLRLVPDGKVVALGIVSTKTPVLENSDSLKRRIDDAAKYAPLERLSLATQCGFASSIVGNPLSEDDEAAKLARIVEVADDVWGTA